MLKVGAVLVKPEEGRGGVRVLGRGAAFAAKPLIPFVVGLSNHAF